MKTTKFRNQTSEEIIKHLAHLLAKDTSYNLTVDPLRIHFTLVESTRPPRVKSAKRQDIRNSQDGLSKGKKRQMGTRKKTRTKIRSVKKFRTVPLKGRTYS